MPKTRADVGYQKHGLDRADATIQGSVSVELYSVPRRLLQVQGAIDPHVTQSREIAVKEHFRTFDLQPKHKRSNRHSKQGS
jgi:hypothetical protein